MSEKQNKDERVLRPDLELLNHQYSDFYPGHYMYDVREIDYPMYRTKILFEYTKVQEIHPIIIAVLKTIQFLESVRNMDAYSELQNITQLDKEILDSILAEMTTKGYLKQNDLQLSTNGKEILEKLREASGTDVVSYTYHNYVINASSLNKGIKYYDIALRIYMGAVLKRVIKKWGKVDLPTTTIGQGKWNDLSGLLLPESEEMRLLSDIKRGELETIQEVTDRFKEINRNYREYQWAWTYQLILDYYHLTEITDADVERIHKDYVHARRAWIAEIRKDAEKEYAMGDVEKHVLDDFIHNLDHEIDFEN